jgi:hypothetical protein
LLLRDGLLLRVFPFPRPLDRRGEIVVGYSTPARLLALDLLLLRCALLGRNIANGEIHREIFV